MAESRYERPETAEQLYELHADLSIVRYAGGAMHAKRSALGGGALLGVRVFFEEGARVAGRMHLTVQGGYETEELEHRTKLTIPVAPKGYKGLVSQQWGAAKPEELVDVAFRATQVLDGYVNLAPTEWRRYRGMPDTYTRITDELDLMETPQVIRRTMAAVNAGAPDAFAAAQRIFL